MTEQLREAVERASKLSTDDQNALACLLIEEIESDSRWDDLSARSQAMLEAMADEVRAERDRGDALPYDVGAA